MNEAMLMAAGAKSKDPDLLVFYSSSIIIYDSDLNNVTSEYISSQPGFSAAASHEQMMFPPRQSKYLGFGTWARDGALNGAVADISAIPWIFYTDYTAISVSTDGNAYIRHMAPNSAGYVAGFSPALPDEAVCSITSKEEITGQPSSFSGLAQNVCKGMKVYDDFLYQWGSNGILKYSFNGSVLSLVSSTSESYSVEALGVNSNGSSIAIWKADFLDVWNSTLTSKVQIDTSPFGITYVESIEFSPDDRYILIGGRLKNTFGGTGGCVVVVDTANSNSATSMAVPPGESNDRFTGCSWYPDSDRYIMSGYTGAKTHLGAVSEGGVTVNLSVAPYNIPNTFGVAAISY